MRMQRWLSALTLIGAISASSYLSAQSEEQAKTIHLEGEKARTLISLLISGLNGDPGHSSSAIAIQHTNIHTAKIALRDLQVLEASTYKYDPDDWVYKLNAYSATAKAGSSDNPVNITEATALWGYLTDLRLKTDLGLEGTYFEIATVDCRIDANIDITAPARFQCDLAVHPGDLGNTGRK